jgi:glycosyltransferase involved in cell wall biosynthesis
MTRQHAISVVVPALNEAPRIGRVLRGLPACVDRVVIIDDGSTDDTSGAAQQAYDALASARRSTLQLHIARNAHARGVGAAIVAGYRHALAAELSANHIIVVMAGDDQMDPRDLDALLAPLLEGTHDYAKGNRFATRDLAREMPLQRRLAGEVLSLATSIATGVRVRDSQCGYTAITSACCAKLPLDALWPGFGYPNDLLSKLARVGARICDVPVRARYRDEQSKLRLRHLPPIGALLWRALRDRKAAHRPQ